MNNEKIKVLFIGGSGRSGSTILQNILGQIDGFFSIGEIRHIWERGLLKNKLCGCGVPFLKCQVWSDVLREAYGGAGGVDADKMYHLTESFRTKDLPLTLLPNVRRKHETRLSEYLENLEKLYQAIQSTTGSRVIVDSSKNAAYGLMVSMLPTVDLYLLHFVRNAQAVAYSWSKKKLYEAGDYMPRMAPVNCAMVWNVRNITVEMFLERSSAQHMTLRYEDFVSHPQTSVEDILKLLGEEEVKLPFVAPDSVELDQDIHSVHGNEVRFHNGPVKLRLDNQWRTNMDRGNRLAVQALTWPLQLKYGYLRSGARPAPN